MAIFDNHFHLRPSGLGVAAAKQFEAAGGTALMLTHSPYDEVPIRSGDDYERAYAVTLSLAEAVRRETGLQVFVALGPYPVDLVAIAKAGGVAAGERTLERGIEVAAREIRAGRATALGEVGRPHFPVATDVRDASNRILARAVETARDLGCAVIVHSEEPTAETYRGFASMLARAGASPGKFVKHHSSPLTDPSVTCGVVPSILAREDLLAEARRGNGPFLMETDYIDDPRRPGAVLGPATVPRKTARWLAQGKLSDREADMIHRLVPGRTYGVDL